MMGYGRPMAVVAWYTWLGLESYGLLWYTKIWRINTSFFYSKYPNDFALSIDAFGTTISLMAIN